MMDERKLPRILLVDDDPTQNKLLEGLLVDKGYDCLVADQAAEGLSMAMNGNPDIIILDVMMPIINGYNFCRLLKSEEKMKGVPIILLTSRDEMKDIEIGMEMGADAYLTKPVNTEELLRTIQVVQGAENESDSKNK